MACPMCEAMVKSRRGVPPHAKLAKIGEPKKVKVPGQANVYVTMYRCTDCNTKWQYADDKNDDFAGWTMTE